MTNKCEECGRQLTRASNGKIVCPVCDIDDFYAEVRDDRIPDESEQSQLLIETPSYFYASDVNYILLW
jgi:uncharacterized Zn finger protein (UPF0148 family)